MAKKWLAILAGAAAASAVGYGITRMLAGGGKEKKDESEPAPVTEEKASPDSRIEQAACPSCGKPVKEYDLFCPYCGHEGREKKEKE